MASPNANQNLMEREQMKSIADLFRTLNKISELCFSDCVWDLTSRKINKEENKCSLNCAEKFLKSNQRISTRFQEFQILANENALEAMKKAGVK